VDDKWTWPEEVVNGVVNDTLRYPCWNPVLFLPKQGPLMLFYKVGPSPQEWWGMLITSADHGKSWSKPVKLGEDKKIGHLIGPVKNKPLQLGDGTIISPSSTELKTKTRDSDWRVHFEISKDNGKTWKVVGPINDGVEFDAIQPSILTYRDRRMQALCRTGQDVIAQTWSSDNGTTWSKLTALQLPNPNSGTDAVTLKDGRQLLVYNHTTRKGAEPKGRNMLNLALSNDGITWKPVMTLENEPRPDGYAYPAIIQSSNGMVHITYTYNRRSIKYVLIDPAKL
jgi:predicted neuraminidase